MTYEELGHRLLTSAHFKWMPGMLSLCGARGDFGKGAIPDVRDPATVGCLLYLVRRRWQEEGLYVMKNSCNLWTIPMSAFSSNWTELQVGKAYPSEVEALVVMLCT